MLDLWTAFWAFYRTWTVSWEASKACSFSSNSNLVFWESAVVLFTSWYDWERGTFLQTKQSAWILPSSSGFSKVNATPRYERETNHCEWPFAFLSSMRAHVTFTPNDKWHVPYMYSKADKFPPLKNFALRVHKRNHNFAAFCFPVFLVPRFPRSRCCPVLLFPLFSCFHLLCNKLTLFLD